MLHDKGILHRDLKPSNIFMLNYYSAVVADLGISKPLSELLELKN